MRRLVTMAAITAVFSALALAETWTGRLVDSTCMNQQNQQQSQQQSATTCNPTSATTNFGIEVQGKTYELDSAGNQKAQDALKNRAEREKNPSQTETTPVHARVTGTMEGNTIKVDTLSVR
jgi:hypothetical protein